MFAALRGSAENNPLVLDYIALRQPENPGVSILFAEHDSLENFLHQMKGILDQQGEIKTRQFEVPPQNVFHEPVIILGAPRSGTTLLFEILSCAPDVWTIGGESHEVIESGGAISSDRGNRLEAVDASARTCELIRAMFISILRNRDGTLYLDSERPQCGERVRFLEKTPKNSLRVPFLRAIFPDCRFVFLYREPFSNIGSLIDAWNTPERFNSYRFGALRWKLLLPPQWKDLIGKPVPEIAAAQWHAANTFILNDLAILPRDHWHFVDYRDLIKRPEAEIKKICAFASLATDQVLDDQLRRPLPLSSSALTPPSTEKWRRHQVVLDRVVPTVQDVIERIQRI